MDYGKLPKNTKESYIFRDPIGPTYMIIRKKGSERGIYEDSRQSTRRLPHTRFKICAKVSVRCMSCTSPAPPAAWSFSQVSMLGDVVENAQFLHISIKN